MQFIAVHWSSKLIWIVSRRLRFCPWLCTQLMHKKSEMGEAAGHPISAPKLRRHDPKPWKMTQMVCEALGDFCCWDDALKVGVNRCSQKNRIPLWRLLLRTSSPKNIALECPTTIRWGQVGVNPSHDLFGSWWISSYSLLLIGNHRFYPQVFHIFPRQYTKFGWLNHR